MPDLLRFGRVTNAANPRFCSHVLPSTFLHYFIYMLGHSVFTKRTSGIHPHQTKDKDLIVTHFDILITQRKSKELNNDKNH